VETGAPVLYHVHADHLNRPLRMTAAASAAVLWTAEWLPWGEAVPGTLTSSPSLAMRFPGQWYQLESGLHYNWHRHYDPSLGRFTQPDPLGFVDGPSVYGYAGGNPLALVDPDGRLVGRPPRPEPPGTQSCPVKGVPGSPDKKCSACLDACAGGSRRVEKFCQSLTLAPPLVRAGCWAAAVAGEVACKGNPAYAPS